MLRGRAAGLGLPGPQPGIRRSDTTVASRLGVCIARPAARMSDSADGFITAVGASDCAAEELEVVDRS